MSQQRGRFRLSALLLTAVTLMLSLLLSPANANSDEHRQSQAASPEVEASKSHRVPSGGLPEVGRVKLRWKDKKPQVTMRVTFRRSLNKKAPRRATEEGTVRVEVFKKERKNGSLTRRILRKHSVMELTRGPRKQTAKYRFELTKRAKRALRLNRARGWQKARQQLLTVTATHRISGVAHELTPGVRAQHDKITRAAGDNRHIDLRRALKKAAGSVSAAGLPDDDNNWNTAQVTLVNDSGLPLNLVENSLLCMDENYVDLSDPAGFNAQQGATIANGRTIEQVVSADKSLDTEADYQGLDPEKLQETYDSFGLGVASKIAKKIPGIGAAISEAISIYESCSSNVSAFAITAIDASEDAASPPAASNQAWAVVAEDGTINDGFYNNTWFRHPFVTLDAAASADRVADDYDTFEDGWWDEATRAAFATVFGGTNSEWNSCRTQSDWLSDTGLSWQTAPNGTGQYGLDAFTITVKKGGTSNQYVGTTSWSEC